MNLVDSSGWLEYFTEGPNADFFSKVIADTKNLIVSTINIYEVFKKIIHSKDEKAALQAIALMQQVEVINVTSGIALSAAKLSIELNLPMADSLILATADSVNAVLWTQDSDFKTINRVKYIPKSN